jgi:hypothetical protein
MTTTNDDGRTYHDVAHARAVREARADVVEKARALVKGAVKQFGYDTHGVWSHDAEALSAAVRALDAVEGGKP